MIAHGGATSCARPLLRRRAVRAALVAAFLVSPPLAGAFAQPGQKIDPVQLPTLEGGKAPLLSPAARANVFVFVRPDQDRSIEAIRQAAACQKELGAKGARFVLVASGAADPAEIKKALSTAGATLPVLLDVGDKLYSTLEIRLYPVAGFVDGKGVIQAMEPYRQVDFGDVLRARTRFLLGEIDRAAMEAAANPAAAPMPGDDPVAKAMRDVKMARKMLELGQPEVAAKQAQHALEQAPVPEAFPVLGLAYAKLGKCAEAKRMLDQAQAALPQSAEIPQGRALCK